MTITHYNPCTFRNSQTCSESEIVNHYVNVINLMRRTLWNSDMSQTYPKYHLHNLEVSFEGLGMEKSCLFELKNYL
ncbi:hypothetical protein Hanom_Chr02g00117601 [Helianthus anomalus]